MEKNPADGLLGGLLGILNLKLGGNQVFPRTQSRLNEILFSGFNDASNPKLLEEILRNISE